ncbi:sigma-54-dependent transcriptional regulator [Pseudomonas oligotrophica]|uniref:sigma-54-dependent transcriptional regulator n=1 Tax=Pseudomonas oligotrophica TaxID=2912055 RepID=UPI001F2492B6|nr:sigma-54 dependent transcriptional regulator [Pseudomonas oligotrophica]MCF7202796.1 sigma-54 dependent transcriptional regulator [Pseudomonas oligotrophica]
MVRILLVEDDAALREALGDTLELAGYDYHPVASAEAALAALDTQRFTLVVSDVNMPGMDGHGLLCSLRRQHPGLPVILMTAFAEVEKAVEAMRQGALDYLVKPFEPARLLALIARHAGAGVRSPADTGPVAREPASLRLLALAERVARSDSTVLISGESGTGKEVLARYVHERSSRAERPFVAINCAAIPDTMLEATLFGHEKGAFTGALTAQPGKFEQANGGTLLLDEISEMPLALQAKLLRVLQEREVERVGGRQPVLLDIRILATTNRDIQAEVAAGRFREDLFYRLSVFPLSWPPLRERRGDILPLAERLLARHAARQGLERVRLSEQAGRSLVEHDWPGNVRELDNAIQRALILQQDGVIEAADLFLGRAPLVPEPAAAEAVAAAPASPLGDDLRRREYQLIIDTLRAERGRRKEAAERLGISPRTLRYKLAQMRDAGLDVEGELFG